jgi:AAA domain
MNKQKRKPTRKPKTKLTKTTSGIKSAKELQKVKFQPLRWVVQRYLPEGLSMLAGRTKIGKSVWLLNLGVCVAYGRPFMEQECEQGDVLALCLEDSDRRLQDRLTKMLEKKESWPRSLYYATNWPRLSDGGLLKISEWIQTVKNPRLITIDILQRVRDNDKAKKTGSQYGNDYEALVTLHELCQRKRVAICVAHHQRKSDAHDLVDTVHGTMGTSAALDTVCILAKDDVGYFLDGRGRDVDEYRVALKRDQYWWHYERERSGGDAPVSPERAQIRRVLMDAGRAMSIPEIVKATDMKLANVKMLLSKMHSADEIEKPQTGRYQLPELH